MATGLLKQGADLPKGKITVQSVREQMHVTPQQGQQLDRIVLAGKKAMFSQKSHKLLLDQLKGPGTIEMKLGQGIAGLMALLMQESKNSLPPSLIIPAGLILLVVAAQFLRQTGTKISDQEIAGGMDVMTTALLHAVGIDPEKAAAMGERGPAAKPGVKPASGVKPVAGVQAGAGVQA